MTETGMTIIVCLIWFTGGLVWGNILNNLHTQPPQKQEIVNLSVGESVVTDTTRIMCKGGN